MTNKTATNQLTIVEAELIIIDLVKQDRRGDGIRKGGILVVAATRRLGEKRANEIYAQAARKGLDT